jgi:hypothetical protein
MLSGPARLAAGVALALAGLAAAPAAGGAGLLASARLEGVFAMSGRVTDAVNAGTEHRGERVHRTWTFSSTCPSGACDTVALKRTRSRTDPARTDQLVLRRHSPGFYRGTATFLAPVRCGGRRYARGEAVPFSITVRVTAAATVGDQVLANSVRAFYRNPRRVGLTRCVTAPAHDAARYTGRLVISPGGTTRSEPSTAPTAAS